MDKFEEKKASIYRELLAEHKGIHPEKIEVALRFMNMAARRSVRIEALFARHGLTPGRFWLLMLLRREPGRALSPSVLAERFVVTRSTMTQFLDGLEKEELVRRSADPNDRRAALVEMTPKAESLLKKLIPIHLKRLSQFGKVLTQTERRQFLAILEKLDASMSAADED